MPRGETGSTRPADDGGQPLVPYAARALEQSRQLGRQIADLAERIAESEDLVASTLEESARIRPHAGERLRSAAEAARRFAEVERDHSRRLRRSVDEQVADAE